MKKHKLIFFILGIVAVILIAGAFILSSNVLKKNNDGSTKETAGEGEIADISNLATQIVEVPEPKPEPEPEPVFEEYDIHILAVGDNLYHTGVINSGKKSDGTLNYDHEFIEIADFLELADIKIINQETPLAGNDRGFSSYPVFNTPTEVGDATAKAGFNVVLGATNHAFDQGISGLVSFYNFYKNNYPEILLCGIHGDEPKTILPNTVTGDEGVNIVVTTAGTASDVDPEEEAASVVIDDAYDYSRINLIKVKDITFAVLNYSYGNNTETFSSAQESHMDSLCDWDPGSRYYNFEKMHPQVIEDIKLAETIADITIVCPHWGVEYQTSPSTFQKSWGAEMVAAGADVIIGAHPHVPQPVEWITAENGNEGICYYSLGNYVSTQNQASVNMLEEMAWVSIHVTEDGAYVNEPATGVIPLVNHYTFNPLCYQRTYLLEDYTDELANAHGILGWGGFPLKLETLQNLKDEIMGNMVITRNDVYSQFDPVEIPAR